jgi:hypothetical protein
MFLHNLLNVLVQIANKIGYKKINAPEMIPSRNMRGLDSGCFTQGCRGKLVKVSHGFQTSNLN